MRTIETKVYTYGELSESARETARQNYAAEVGFISADEALASLRALAEHFGGKLTDYSIDFFNTSHSTARFDMPDFEGEHEDGPDAMIEELASQLGEYNPETLRGLGDCVLTGVCHDEDAIDGFRALYMTGERDLAKLMEAAFRTWLAACQDECEGFYSDEDFGEHAEANDLEFYADGSPFSR